MINTRLLILNKLDGIGWFSYETLRRITKDHPEHHFTFLFDRTPDPALHFSENVTPLVLKPQARHPVLFWIWFEFSVASVLKKLKPDLFVSPDGYLPLKSQCKKLAVIHDLNFAHYPNDLPWTVRKYYNHFFPKFAASATRIATVSDYSKQDLVKTYGVNPSKIDIVYNGAHADYKPLDSKDQKLVRQQFSEGAPYFLFVGSIHPRKNIGRLMQAFDRFRKQYGKEFKLLIAGSKYWWTSELESTYQRLEFKDQVIFTGRLTQADLVKVMASASALTYLPYFEGFGIPLLEAMNCDVPVITSNISSLPEVAGDAALCVDPFSVPVISEAMLRVVEDVELRKKLILAGQDRRKNFSWDKTSSLLWESMLKTIRS